MARRNRARGSRTFQSLELFEDLSVRDNLLAGSDDFGLRPYLTDIFWPRPAHLSATAMQAIHDLDLESVLDEIARNERVRSAYLGEEVTVSDPSRPQGA